MQKVVRAGNKVVLDEKELAHSKYSRWNDDQAGREQRCGQNGHVDLLRWNRSSFQLPGTASGQTAFAKPVRTAALCRCENAKNRKCEQVDGTKLNGLELLVKKTWHGV